MCQRYFGKKNSFGNQEQLTIGYRKIADSKSPNFLHFQGKIDEICIYDRQLAIEEIQELVNQGLLNSIPDIKSTLFLPFTLIFILIIMLVGVIKLRKYSAYNKS